MTVFGAIDVGTNSMRLLIGQIVGTGQLMPIKTSLITTRLGDKMWETPKLTDQAVDRALAAFGQFQNMLQQYCVDHVKIVATSAVRESANKDDFVKKVHDTTGLTVEVISGEEEAWLGYIGVKWGTSVPDAAVIVDIGGGSTEIIYTKDQAVVAKSIPIGAVGLTGNPLDRKKLHKKFAPIIDELKQQLADNYTLIGIGGTVTTCVAIKERLTVYEPKLVHQYVLQLVEIKEIRNMLANLDIIARKKVAGLMPERADIIVAGVDILITLMEALGKETIQISEADILYGIIWQQYRDLHN